MAVAVIQPFDWFSRALNLDAPHNLIAAAIGRPATGPCPGDNHHRPELGHNSGHDDHDQRPRREFTAADPLRMSSAATRWSASLPDARETAEREAWSR